MSDAVAGVGAQFKIGDGASAETFTAVAEVRSIRDGGLSAQQLEATNLDSTGAYREYIVGFLDGGEITLNMNWTPGGWNTFKDFIEGRAAKNCQIVSPDTGQWTDDFACFCTGMERTIDFDGIVTMDISLKATGQRTSTT
jgi:predicted secreted protein